MHRRFSSFVKASSSKTPEDVTDDNLSSTTVNTIREPDELLPIPSLKVKRVDHYYSRWYKTWKYRNMSSSVKVETVPVMQSGINDPWKDFSFVIVRKIPKEDYKEPTFRIVVKSEYVLKACKEVIKYWPGVSWNADPLELDPDMFITFLDEFASYRDKLATKKPRTELESHLLSSVELLISTFNTDYKSTLTKLENFKAHGEINFEFLQYLLVPRTIFVAKCSMTGKTRLFKLLHAQRTTIDGNPVYSLCCESVDLVDRLSGHNGVRVGTVQTYINLKFFKGTTKIQGLNAFPLRFHPDAERIRASLLNRGKKWLDMIGIHHKQYKGIAALKCGDRIVKHTVDSRIMVDRVTFRKNNPNYQFPIASLPLLAGLPAQNTLPQPQMSSDYLPIQPAQVPMQYIPPRPAMAQPLPPIPLNLPFNSSVPYIGPGNASLVQNQQQEEAPGADLEDDEIILASTTVYGFSFADKMWFEFDVDKIQDVEWNDDAFKNLVLPSSRKNLLQSLVESHHRGTGFDDFIKGKGHGLVVNLFGPPGVGKTFSAEATAEHVRKPLYVVGGGDLGTKAADLDMALERIFNVATAWKAIVLIDEADVFLEQRSLHDLERNAMVAVFLRHVEYYRGILFLTTNRVQAFDEAFLSRIHVALHFSELSVESREQVWTAFINKIGAPITKEQISELSTRNINGRQIKNAARTAQSLAVGRGEQIEYHHFLETLNAMAEFTQEFKEMRKLD